MSDGRIPVWIGDDATAPPGAEVVSAGGAGAAAHPVGCACCSKRPPLAAALAALHLGRVRAGEALDRPVLIIAASPTEAVEARALLASDRLLRARFRLLGEPPARHAP